MSIDITIYTALSVDDMKKSIDSFNSISTDKIAAIPLDVSGTQREIVSEMGFGINIHSYAIFRVDKFDIEFDQSLLKRFIDFVRNNTECVSFVNGETEFHPKS